MYFFTPQSSKNELYSSESNGGPLSDDISSGALYVQNQLLNMMHIAIIPFTLPVPQL